MNKKWAIRAAAAVAVCVASLLVAAPVLAPWGWCDVDPVLDINGHIVNIDIAFQGDPAILAEGVDFYLNVPRGVEINLVSTDPNAFVNIHVNQGKTDLVHVRVDFATDDNVPATLKVVIDDQLVSQVYGSTSSSLVCKFSAE